MCIFCFLSKKNQKILRNKAQLATDRFEHCLNFYKKIYIEGFKAHIHDNLCEKHSHLTEELQLLKEMSIEDILKVFNIFEKAYMKWINNDSSESRKIIEEYLETNHLFKEVSLVDKLMFRARFSDVRLSHWDMFHIPFNKRYFINNQRYSLVGRPMLYLGFSPKYVLEEIGYKEDDKNCYISAFYLKDKENLNVCDFRYHFFETDQMVDKLTEDKENLTKESLEQKLYLCIIASICSFKKRSKDSSIFCEEYVLPQILSEIVNSKKEFDGLLYTSTKSDEESENPFFDANAVIFTKYNEDKSQDVTYTYDRDLYNKFEITTAKKVEDISDEYEDIVTETFKNVSSPDYIDKLTPFLMSELTNVLSNKYMNHEEFKLGYNIHKSVLYEILVNKIY